MFDVAINALCDYADQLAAQGSGNERKAVQNCISILNRIFFEYEDHCRVVDDYSTTDPVEAEILQMLGIEVRKYRNKIWYEFKVSSCTGNAKRCDTVEEVVAFLVDRFNKDEHDLESALVREAVKEVLAELELEKTQAGEKLTKEDRFYIKRVGNKLRDLMEDKLRPKTRTMRKEDL